MLAVHQMTRKSTWKILKRNLIKINIQKNAMSWRGLLHQLKLREWTTCPKLTLISVRSLPYQQSWIWFHARMLQNRMQSARKFCLILWTNLLRLDFLMPLKWSSKSSLIQRELLWSMYTTQMARVLRLRKPGWERMGDRCERMGYKSQQDGGLAYVCRDAWEIGLSQHAGCERMGWPRRGGMGGLHMYVET